MEKKLFRIPLVWQEYGHIDIEATSLKEAIEIALGPETPLPDGDYVEESVEVDRELLFLDKDEDYDESTCYNLFVISLDAEIKWKSNAQSEEDAAAEFFEELSYVDGGILLKAEYDIREIAASEVEDHGTNPQ